MRTLVPIAILLVSLPAAAGDATPVDSGLLLIQQPAIKQMAATEAPGMTGTGPLFGASFQQGQTFEQPITLEAGKCYTVIGNGVGMQNLDIKLLATLQPGAAPIVLAQDTSVSPIAVVAGKMCFKFPHPTNSPGKVVLTATSGAGVAAAQVYVK